MLELIDWIRNDELMDKLSSPLFWLTLAAFGLAGHYLGAALFGGETTMEEKE